MLPPSRPGMGRPQELRMRSPRSGDEEFHFLRHHERTKLTGKSHDEVRICENRLPVSTTIRIVIELPEMHELIDDAGIGLEISDELFVVTTLLQGREPQFLIQLHRFAHLSDVERVGSHLVKGHRTFLPPALSRQPIRVERNHPDHITTSTS